MNTEYIAENLRRIRGARAGLSQGAVAGKAGLSLRAYQDIESGKAEPRVANLDAIARALGVPIRMLLEPVRELRDVRFRSNKKMKTRRQILADVARWLDDYNGMEALLGERRPFVLRGVAEDGLTGAERARAAAQRARRSLGLTADEPVRDICGILDFAGVKVFPIVVQSDGFFGLSVGAEGGGPAVVVNTWDRITVERWIFSAAHELGHLLLHLDDYGLDDEEENSVHEAEADAFAAEFLMPDEVFQREWDEARGLPLYARVLKVKRIFRVSYATVLKRVEPTYEGWAKNIWAQFYTEHKQHTGKSLVKNAEPEGLGTEVFYRAASSSKSGQEPDSLSSWDFQEDRLASLVRRAVDEGEISLGRGAEVLGKSLTEMRALATSWCG